MDTGIFIVVEGMDGCGKTTISDIVAKEIEDMGIDVVRTFEVGGTPIGKELRKLCFSKREDEKLDPVARLLMVLAARIQHVQTVIKPALREGKVVVCDRFYPSTRVFQGDIDGLEYELFDLEQFGEDYGLGITLEPDLVLSLKIDPELAYKRGKAREFVDNDTYKTGIEQAKQTAAAYEIQIDRLLDEGVNVVEIDVTDLTIAQIELVIKDKIKEFFDDSANEEQPLSAYADPDDVEPMQGWLARFIGSPWFAVLLVLMFAAYAFIAGSDGSEVSKLPVPHP